MKLSKFKGLEENKITFSWINPHSIHECEGEDRNNLQGSEKRLRGREYASKHHSIENSILNGSFSGTT